jgi:isopenicillin N synthase-like dioxygenase
MARARSIDGVLDVPVIDLSGWPGGDSAVRAGIAAQVDQAQRSVGFMQVTGHGIPAAVIDHFTRAMDAFFALPLGDKSAYIAPAGVNRGYTPPRAEALSASLGVATTADLFEAYNVGAAASQWPGLDIPTSIYPENVWPQITDFQGAVQAWQDSAGALARTLTSIFALALGLPTDFFASYTSHSIDVLRMINYRLPSADVDLAPDQLGMGAHTDYGIVTVLWADPVPGLQILDADGVWHDVLPAPGALLVNLGDVTARLTNDEWLSTMHRVRPPMDESGRLIPRRSAAYFHDGNYDAVVAPVPQCVGTGGTPLYQPVTIAEHITAKLAGSRLGELNSAAERDAARLINSAG